MALFLLNPGLDNDRDAVAAELAANHIELPVLMDDTHLVTEMLGIGHMDEVVVYDPTSFEIAYRGPVQSGAEDAVEALLAGSDVELVSIAGAGSAIPSNESEHSELSYVNDMRPSSLKTAHNVIGKEALRPLPWTAVSPYKAGLR